MGKGAPKTPLTKEQAAKFIKIKTLNKIDGIVDQSEGRRTRMSQDGGSNRRLRQ